MAVAVVRGSKVVARIALQKQSLWAKLCLNKPLEHLTKLEMGRPIIITVGVNDGFPLSPGIIHGIVIPSRWQLARQCTPGSIPQGKVRVVLRWMHKCISHMC